MFTGWRVVKLGSNANNSANTEAFYIEAITMKSQSDIHPPDQTKSRGKTQVNYNVHEVKITDEQGTRTAYKYDYVNVEGKVTKAKVFAAMQAEELVDDSDEWTPDEVAADLRRPHAPPTNIHELGNRIDTIEAMLGIGSIQTRGEYHG